MLIVPFQNRKYPTVVVHNPGQKPRILSIYGKVFVDWSILVETHFPKDLSRPLQSPECGRKSLRGDVESVLDFSEPDETLLSLDELPYVPVAYHTLSQPRLQDIDLVKGGSVPV